MQFPRLTIRENSPFCDSDEEVFFGPVTSKELEKASKLKRRTQVYFPGATRNFSQLFTKETASLQSPEGRYHLEGKPESSNELKMGNHQSISNDVNIDPKDAISTEPEDSLEHKFQQTCSVKSEDSLESNVPSSLNVAHIESSYSNDSLDRKSEVSAHTISLHSDDSLNSKSAEVPGQTFSVHSNEDSLDKKALSSLISDDSLDKNSHCQTFAQTFSVCSDDSLNSGSQKISNQVFSLHSDQNKSHQSHTCSSQSEDGNDFKSQSSFNTAQICSLQSKSQDDHNSQDLLNVALINSDSSVNSESRQLESALTGSLPSDYETDKNSSVSFNTAMACSVESGVAELVDKSSYSHKLCDVTAFSEKITGNSGDLLQSAPLPNSVEHENAKANVNEPLLLNTSCSENNLTKPAPVDKDGGYLSILSEAALFHASQRQQRSINHVQQSLEDRFREFGVRDDDLEKQQLSESIMYTTGRDSCLLYNTSAYFPSKGLGKNEIGQNENEDAKIDEECSFLDVGSGTATLTIHNDVHSSKNSFPSSERPQRDLVDNCFGSEVICQRSEESDQDQSSENVARDLSGVWEQDEGFQEKHNDSTEMHTAHSDVANSSEASSVSDRMNDTLEEYEMMMRYGVDYILGSMKKNGKADHCSENEKVKERSSDIIDTNLYHETEDDVGYSVSSPSKEKAKSIRRSLSPTLRIKCEDKVVEPFTTAQTTPKRRLTPNKPIPKQSPHANGSSAKANSQKMPASFIPRAPRTACIPTRQLQTPSPKVIRQMTPNVTPGSGVKTNAFKKPVNPVSASRLPKYASSTGTPRNNVPKSNQKVLGNIQSPVSAYIHNTASPILVTNVKAKAKEVGSWENEMHARALWKAGECGSSIPKPRSTQVSNIENLNPDAQCGLPAVKYTRAPCIKLGEPGTTHLPKVSDKITKLLDTPCPQVIKHEGRLNIKSGSPHLAAKVQAATLCPDDSMMGTGCAPGDVSVCITKAAVRTDTLSCRSPSKPSTKF